MLLWLHTPRQGDRSEVSVALYTALSILLPPLSSTPTPSLLTLYISPSCTFAFRIYLVSGNLVSLCVRDSLLFYCVQHVFHVQYFYTYMTIYIGIYVYMHIHNVYSVYITYTYHFCFTRRLTPFAPVCKNVTLCTFIELIFSMSLFCAENALRTKISIIYCSFIHIYVFISFIDAITAYSSHSFWFYYFYYFSQLHRFIVVMHFRKIHAHWGVSVIRV